MGVAEAQVTEVTDAVRHGSLTALHGVHDGAFGGVVLGDDLAVKLGVFVGDTINILTPESATLTPMGLLPRQRKLEIVGIFSLGFWEYDSSYGFVTLDVAKRLFKKDRVDRMDLRVENRGDSADVARAVTETLGPGYLAEDWFRLNQALFSALRLEKLAIGITIGLIMMVAALNIVASLVLLVMEKSRDIAILKTMGASARSIRGIFVLQGGIIGAVGTTVGAVCGVAISTVADRYQLIRIPIDVYDIAWIPFTIELGDFFLVVGASLLICLLATLYPSRQASRLDPAEALRHQ